MDSRGLVGLLSMEMHTCDTILRSAMHQSSLQDRVPSLDAHAERQKQMGNAQSSKERSANVVSSDEVMSVEADRQC